MSHVKMKIRVSSVDFEYRQTFYQCACILVTAKSKLINFVCDNYVRILLMVKTQCGYDIMDMRLQRILRKTIP